METHANHIHNRWRFRIMGSLILLLLVLQGPSLITKSAPKRQSGTVRYAIDPQKGRFIAHAFASGLFWFQGHDHYLAARDFSGDVEVTPKSVAPASLRLVVKTNSLEETGSAFNDQQKQIINKEVRDTVLLPEKHPEIIFESTSVTSTLVAPGEYDLKIVGNLTLLGVTRQETIPVRLHLSDNDLQAVGRFSIDRGHYKVKATSAAHGFVRVSDKVRLEFDIVAHHRNQ